MIHHNNKESRPNKDSNPLIVPSELIRGTTFFPPYNCDPRTLRNVTIEIRNYLKDITLQHPNYFIKSGIVHSKPLPVLGCRVERCCFSKTHGSLKGTEGLLSFQFQLNSSKCEKNTVVEIHGHSSASKCNPELGYLAEANRNGNYILNIMWSAPIFYPYWQGIGIWENKNESLSDVYDRMYYGDWNRSLFSRTTALHTISHETTVFNIPVTILSKMSDDDDAQLVVEIR